MTSGQEVLQTRHRWTESSIQIGIERYISEHGVMPSSSDFDESSYLPSARQIQRVYGGLVALRTKLGYTDIDFTKGTLRSAIAKAGNERGLTAEDYFEPLLIDIFGEPFVHTQKRYYKGSKNRYDFLVYAHNLTFGIDIFTTERKSYISNNLKHKIARYKNAPANLPIYFVLVGKGYTSEDVRHASLSIGALKQFPNMQPLHESEFLKLISVFKPLSVPDNFQSLDDMESKQKSEQYCTLYEHRDSI